MQELMDLVNNDPGLSRRGTAYNIQLGLVVGEQNFLFEITDGKLTKVEQNPNRHVTDGFTLSIPRDSWAKFCQPVPPPEFHDIFAMLSRGHLGLTGDSSLLMSNLLYVTGFLNHTKKILTLEKHT